MARNPDGTFAAEHGAGPDLIWHLMEPGEPYTTGELADKVGAPRRTVYNYLCELESDDLLNVKKPTGRLKIWWREP